MYTTKINGAGPNSRRNRIKACAPEKMLKEGQGHGLIKFNRLLLCFQCARLIHYTLGGAPRTSGVTEVSDIL